LPRNSRNPHRELSNSTVFAASTRSAHVRQPALWRHCRRRQISARRILPASRAFMRPFRLLRLKEGGIDDDRSLLKQKLTVTEREAEVLLWIARGKSNRHIAKILDLSPRTVNKHLEQIRQAQCGKPRLRRCGGCSNNWHSLTDATPILVGRCEPNTTEQNFRFVLSKFASRERLAPVQNPYCNRTFRLNPYPTKTGNFERCLTGEDSLTAGNSGAS